MPFRWMSQRTGNRAVQLAAQLLVVMVNVFSLRPVRWLVRRQATPHRIDPKGKKLIKGRMKRMQTERPLSQQIPIKGFHVPNVKNNPMPLRNRPVVKRIFAHYAEHVVGAFACIYQAGVKIMPNADSASCGSHACLPSLDAAVAVAVHEKLNGWEPE